MQELELTITSFKPTRKDFRTLREMFLSVGYGRGLSDIELFRSIWRSSHIVCAWEGDVLVGLARSMDDGIWSATIDIVAVRREYHGMHIGSLLVHLLAQSVLKDVRRIHAFPNGYEQMYLNAGFKPVSDNSYIIERE